MEWVPDRTLGATPRSPLPETRGLQIFTVPFLLKFWVFLINFGTDKLLFACMWVI